MKAASAWMAAATALAIVAGASAQQQPKPAQQPGAPAPARGFRLRPRALQKPAPAPAKVDPQVARATAKAQDQPPVPSSTEPTDGPQTVAPGSELPPPASPEEMGAPTIALPTGPIEPYLITKDVGPFMVNAHVFRGENATRYAQALVMELRNAHKLPAYIYHLKFMPGQSNIQGMPPTAKPYVRTGQLSPPELDRIHDEAAVLVGNCKTIDEAEDLLHRVQKTHVDCLDGIPSMWKFRKNKGLTRATLTQNPLVAAQNMFAGQPENGAVVDPSILRTNFTPKPDALIKRMNSGPFCPRSIFKCPAPYTMVVAEFSGRATLDANDQGFKDGNSLLKSPLRTAHEDAEKLAEALAKNDQVVRAGYQPYVYHDRYTSRVTLGAFQTPDDPQAKALRELAPKVEVVEKRGREATVHHLTPANELMAVPRP